MTLSRTSIIVALGLVLASGLTSAQQAAVTMDNAVKQALTKGPDLASSLATLENARADLKAKQSDPSTLVLAMTQAENSVQLETVRVDGKRLEVMSNVTSAYISLFEAQENISVLEAQVGLDQKNLEVAKTKLSLKNGTALDVSKAENALANNRQSLLDARAQLPILSNKLEPLLGLPLSANLRAASAPAFKEFKVDVNALEAALDKRSASVVQAAQNVEVAELNVRLSDNDFTAPATLRDAKTQLENAKRSLETTRKNAVTSLRDAHRNLQNTLEKIKIAKRDLDNAQDALEQDQTKFKSGTISRVQLQSTEVSTMRSKYSYAQAVDAYWRALTQLSTAAGTDVTGMIANALKD